MKIVYVGDNRHRGNFGCRATSTALSMLISEGNEIVGRVFGDYTNGDTGELFVNNVFPKALYEKLGNMKYWNYMKTVGHITHRILKKGKFFFSKYDFISKDFDKSIDKLQKCIPANQQLKDFDLTQYDFDALVVNGEGSFIFATPAWRECLIEAMLMYWALKLGKKVYFLNAMLSDDPYTARNQETINLVQPIFEKCEVISVREKYSFKYAEENFSNIKLKHFPDALFSWYDLINDDFEVKNGKYIMGMSGAEDSSFYDFDFSKPYICISGSSSIGLASKYKDEPVDVYTKLVSRIKEEFKNYNVFLVDVCEGDAFLHKVSRKTETPIISIDTPILSAAKILANSEIFISGRYHPAILASLGGTPCVFMSSNSHKTKSVQELLNYDVIKEHHVLPNDDEIEDIINDAKIKLKEGSKLRKKIKNRALELSNLTKKQKDLLK